MTERKATKKPAERRRYPVGADPRKELRRASARCREETREARTPEQQIASLDERGERALRERARLAGVK